MKTLTEFETREKRLNENAAVELAKFNTIIDAATNTTAADRHKLLDAKLDSRRKGIEIQSAVRRAVHEAIRSVGQSIKNRPVSIAPVAPKSPSKRKAAKAKRR